MSNVSRSWKDVKADKQRADEAAGRDMVEARATARGATSAYILGHRLAELRGELGLTQTDIADRMGISQPRVSKLENGDLAQMEVDTLRRYVDALGGQLQIIVDFKDRHITVSTSQHGSGQLSA